MSEATISGHRGLVMNEPLLFEQHAPGRTGVDLPEPEGLDSRLGGLERKKAIGLPGLSEPQIVRHFTRLSQKNYAIDSGLYPLGSCTMKHNPRLNEKLARLEGFAHAHPLQPVSTVEGLSGADCHARSLVDDHDRDARRCHVAGGGGSW